MPRICPRHVVKVRLKQELVAIQVVHQSSEGEECRCADYEENEPISGEERSSCGGFLWSAVYEEI